MTMKRVGFWRAISNVSPRRSVDLPADIGLLETWQITTLRVSVFLVAVGAVTSPPLANVAAGLCLILFFLLPDLSARVRAISAQPMFRALGIFSLSLLAAAFHAALDVGWREAARSLFEWRHFLLVPVAAAAFAEIAPRRQFVAAYVALAAFAAVAIALSIAFGWSRNPAGVPPGILFRTTVTQALLLAVGGVLALIAALSSTGTLHRGRLLYLAVGVGVVGVLVGSQTGRSGMVAVVVMMIVAALLTLRGRTAVAAVAVVLVLALVAVAYSPVQNQRFRVAAQELAERNADNAVTTSMGVRVLIWRDTSLMIRERPLLGWGLGRYKEAHSSIIARGPSVAAMPVPSSDPHNQFFGLWAEAGLPGLVAFLAVLWGAWRQRGPRPYAVAGLAILAAWCVNSLFSSLFWQFAEAHMIAIFMGVLLARAPGGRQP